MIFILRIENFLDNEELTDLYRKGGINEVMTKLVSDLDLTLSGAEWNIGVLDEENIPKN